jgi:fructose-1,6-bisphosphatase/inositol monophosphatase family enzyme
LLRQQHFPLRLWLPQEVVIKGNVADMEGTTSGSNEPSSFLERLGGLLRQTSTQEILPRFQRLANGDIASKASKEDPTDIVTIAEMPWDHAPGALILRETGGVSRHPDGRDYQASARRELLLTARSETVWQKVRADLFGG